MIKLTDPEGVEYEIKKPEVTIGRSPKSDIVVDDPMASGRHAHLAKEDGKLIIHDDESTNGTRVNGTDITEPMELKDGDMLGVGETEFKVAIPDESEVKATTVMKPAKSDVDETTKMAGDDLLVDLNTAPPPEGATEELGNAMEMAEMAYAENVGATPPEKDMAPTTDAMAEDGKDAMEEKPRPTIGQVKSGAMAVSEEDKAELEEAKEEREMARPGSDQGTMPMADDDLEMLREKVAESKSIEASAEKPEMQAAMAMDEDDMAAMKEAPGIQSTVALPSDEIPQPKDMKDTDSIREVETPFNAGGGMPTLPENEQPSTPSAPSPTGELKNKGMALGLELAAGLLLSLPGIGWLYVGEQQRGFITLGIGAGILVLNIIVLIVSIATLGLGFFCFCATLPALWGVVGYSAYKLNEYAEENPNLFE